MMNTNRKTPDMMEMNMEQMQSVAGGHPFEDCFGDDSLYRAGVTYVNVIIGSDEYYVNGQRIGKETARELRDRSKKLWKANYAESGDYVGYAREWKQILQNDYNLSWNGLMGTYKVNAW